MITRKKVATLLIVVLAAFAAVFGYLYFAQDKMVYHPFKEVRATPADAGMPFEDLTLETSDHVRISGWFVPAPNRRGTVLFFHGNGGNIGHRLDSIRIFRDLRMDVLIIDYRGYGRSEGKPCEQGTYLDAEAAWDYLVNNKKIPPGEIIIFGRSLGSAVAAELAQRHGDAAGLIVESGFTSTADVGREWFPNLPVNLIVRHKYETINKVDRIEMPKLFVHSPGDEIIPYKHGVALFHRAAEPKAFLEIMGGHNTGFLMSGEHYVSGISKFIGECLKQDVSQRGKKQPG